MLATTAIRCFRFLVCPYFVSLVDFKFPMRLPLRLYLAGLSAIITIILFTFLLI